MGVGDGVGVWVGVGVGDGVGVGVCVGDGVGVGVCVGVGEGDGLAWAEYVERYPDLADEILREIDDDERVPARARRALS